MIVKVMPDTTEGIASGTRTLWMICQLVLPIARAACTMPGSTSLSAVSVIRATNGAAAMESGMMVAVVPIAVPSTIRVKGRSTIINITNGKERSTSMMRLKTELNTGRGVMPYWFVVLSSIPSGKPIRIAKRVEKNTIRRVWSVDTPTRIMICSIAYTSSLRTWTLFSSSQDTTLETSSSLPIISTFI